MQFLECFQCGKIEPEGDPDDEQAVCSDCGSEDVQVIAEALLALRSPDGINPVEGTD